MIIGMCRLEQHAPALVLAVSRHMGPCCGNWFCAHACRRVELVMLHEEGAEPSNTAPWLEARPNLARHHHIRITHSKVR